MTAALDPATYLADVIRHLGALSVVILSGCGGTARPIDHAQVERVMEEFRLGWLEQDSAKVMRQISQEVTMFVPGPAGTIAGKDQLRAYWFPSDGKAYPIRKFTVTDQTVMGDGTYAIVQGKSELAWDTTMRDSVISSATSKSEFMTVLRLESDGWKIYRQMFVMR